MKKLLSVVLVLMLLSLSALAAAGVAGETKVEETEDGKKVMTVRPVEEVFTREQDPTINVMGDSERRAEINIRADASKLRNGFLKFEIKGLNGADIEKIVLKMTNSQFKEPIELPPEAKTGGNCGFVVVKLDPNSWKQDELTFATQPQFDEAADKIGEYDPKGANLKVLETISVELDPAFIEKDGLYSFGLFATVGTQDSSFFSTRQPTVGDKYGPVLEITYTGGAAGGSAFYIIVAVTAVLLIAALAVFIIKSKRQQ